MLDKIKDWGSLVLFLFIIIGLPISFGVYLHDSYYQTKVIEITPNKGEDHVRSWVYSCKISDDLQTVGIMYELCDRVKLNKSHLLECFGWDMQGFSIICYKFVGEENQKPIDYGMTIGLIFVSSLSLFALSMKIEPLFTKTQ